MTIGYKRHIFANIEARRTEAEIRKDGEFLALVYESRYGWKTEYFGDAAKNRAQPGLAFAVAAARDGLKHYVNRDRLNAPAGLTPAQLRLWLMKRTGGATALQPGLTAPAAPQANAT